MDNNTINEKLDRIEKKLDKLIDQSGSNNKNCEKMSKHIDFIENIYDNVKNPLGYICEKITTLTGTKTYSIENNNNNNNTMEDT